MFIRKKREGFSFRIRLAPDTEKMLREYISREFHCTLEEKLIEVFKLWIGKALGYIEEVNRRI